MAGIIDGLMGDTVWGWDGMGRDGTEWDGPGTPGAALWELCIHKHCRSDGVY